MKIREYLSEHFESILTYGYILCLSFGLFYLYHSYQVFDGKLTTLLNLIS